MYKRLYYALLAVALGTGITVPAAAAPVVQIAQGIANSTAAEASFLGTLSSFTQENFESLGLQTGNVISTSVGTFTSAVGGQQGPIISVAEGDISGRGTFPLSGHFLESRDSVSVVWNASLGGAAFNALGFFLQDAADQGATLTVRVSDGTTRSIALSGLDDGNVAYIMATFTQPILAAVIDFTNSGQNFNADGWGIDNIVIGRTAGGSSIPEPATLALFAAGLLGLGVALQRRRRRP